MASVHVRAPNVFHQATREGTCGGRLHIAGITPWRALLIFLIALWMTSVACSAASYAVSISVTPQKVAGPNDLVTHVFTITNQGTSDDTYALDLEAPAGWIFLPVPPAVFVSAGSTQVVFVNLSVPSTAEADTYKVTLTATSTGDPNVSAQASGEVLVRSTWGFELEWVSKPPRAERGQRLEGSFEVTNVGNAPDDYHVEIAVSPNWTGEVVSDDFGLLAGGHRVMSFYVIVPATAAADTRYSIRITVSSIQDPTLARTLTLTGQIGPPPPELVGGTLFPEWTVSGTLSVDQEATPALSLRGWGDIPGLGYISLYGKVTIAGIENATAWLDTGTWSAFLDGGAIVGPYVGISGSPLLGGRFGDSGTWRLLFTQEAKGAYWLWQNDTASLRISLGTDSARELSFQQVDARCDFEGPLSARFLIGHVVQTASSGIVSSLGGEIVLDDWTISGSCLKVGPDFPNQASRTECQVRGAYDGCPFPINSSWASTRRLAGTAPDEYHLVSHSFSISSKVVSIDLLSATLSFRIGIQKSDDTPQTTDTRTTSFGCTLGGTQPITWSIAGTFQGMNDFIAGTRTTSQQITTSGQFSLGEIRIVPNLSVQALSGETGTSFSSGFSAVLSAPTLPTSPEVTITLGPSAALKIELSGTIEPDTDLTWTWEWPLCDEPAWSTSISLQFPAAFPFCGPTKGRITGYAFMDENGNGQLDPGEQGVKGILLSANGSEAITGTDGLLVFPPLEPGTYELSFEELPAGLQPQVTMPIEVSLSAGDEKQVLIPLRAQAWIRGRIFNDANQNGAREAGEQGIAGVQVFIKGDGFDKTQKSDGSGWFVVAVPPGAYSVTLDVNSLPERVDPTTPVTLSITAPRYGTVDAEFGVYQKPRPIVITFGPPTASFTVTPDPPIAEEATHFDASSSEAINAQIVSYAWRFIQGDTKMTQTGPQVDIVLPSAGTWQVELVVTDSNGLMGATRKTVQVTEPKG